MHIARIRPEEMDVAAKAARTQALEEAAAICEREANIGVDPEMKHGRIRMGTYLADAIRGLKVRP